MTRESWRTRLGFILAAVGSAVGLGNLWRFPWMTAENGGSAFLVVYLGIVLLVGVPGLLAEFVIGRRAQRNPAGALFRLSGSKSWGAVGLFGVVTAVVLLSFYSSWAGGSSGTSSPASPGRTSAPPARTSRPSASARARSASTSPSSR